jgi:hypothetical protein
MKVAISSGHGKYIRGAADILDEVDEARKVVNEVATLLNDNGVPTAVFHDDVSTTQSENLNRIVNWHNAQTRDLDVSVHFNAYEHTSKPMGTECLYVTQEELADKMAQAIAGASGLIDRGGKYRSDLAFLNGTHEPAILIEVCFVDSQADADIYRAQFDFICEAIAETISGRAIGDDRPPPERPEGVYPVLRESGKCSWFGGPEDEGVAPDEGLAFIYEYQTAPYLFLPQQPPGTTGLARRLDPEVNYFALRFDYAVYPKEMLASGHYMAVIMAPSTGRQYRAWPADWGPNEATGRICDISQGLMTTLGIETDDDIEITFPVHADRPALPERPVDKPTITINVSADQPVVVEHVPGENVET